MTGLSTPLNWRIRLRHSGSLLLLVLLAACGSDGTILSTETALPADSAAAPADTLATADSSGVPPADSSATGGAFDAVVDVSAFSGITFGTNNMLPQYLTAVHTGTMLGGPLGPSNIVSVLTQTRSKGGRIVIKLCKGADKYIKNADGTFSLTKWKALVDQYKSVNLGPFIADGTILAHYLIDEPQRAQRWGGKIISQATIEAMAAHSKNIWPTMTTVVRVVPSWLAAAPVTYTHLDAAWLQYTANKGDVTRLVTDEVAAAKRKLLGLVVGLNVTDGGDGSSKIAGSIAGYSAMSATELTKYGTALLNQSYACGFYMWFHYPRYYDRPEIKTAMAGLSAKAKIHAKTSCRQ
jgi:hypothetical protein